MGLLDIIPVAKFLFGMTILVQGGEIKDNRESQGLTQVPTNISTDVDVLYLNNNKIKNIDTFPSLPKLYEVRIDDNELDEFPNLCNLTKLQWLVLENNVISSIAPARMDCLVGLERLYLRDNLITNIPTVTGTANTLAYIDLRKNYLTRVPRFDVFMKQSNMEYIELRYNPIPADELMTGLGRYAYNCLSLTISNMGLSDESFNNPELTRMTKLKSISATNHPLTKVPDFHYCKDVLESINLDYCHISMIRLNDLKQFKSLKNIYCRQCKVTAVPNILLLKAAPKLTLLSNPIKCDCHSKWVPSEVTENKLSLNSQCSGQPITGLPTRKFTCDKPQDKMAIGVFTMEDPLAFVGTKYLNITEVVPRITQAECAVQCLPAPGCLGYRYLDNQTCWFLGDQDGFPVPMDEKIFILN